LISPDRLAKIEFPESVRSAFLSRSDIAVKKEAGSLFMSGRLRRKWLRIQEIDFAGIVAVSAGMNFYNPDRRKPVKPPRRNSVRVFTFSPCRQPAVTEE
jgi:hypothetical protein